ncbi:nucleotidyltransferase domain-containing protein [Microlunatus sp. Y2014]|uniref:nucleotidyltransferase domain-containing protein n=1 Tax=Microlunatus sp. Y2014 TaxID=3418488 RepID=UPI003DA7A40A
MSTSSSDKPDVVLASVTDFLIGYEGSFWVVGGWAIDLHLGVVTRAHHDVDIAVRADEQHLLEAWIAERDVLLENPMTGDRRPWVERVPLRPGPDALILPDATGPPPSFGPDVL